MDRYAFDVEIFKNFFDVSFVNIATEEIKTFIIWKNQNDRKELLDFLSERNFLVSFNGLSYDMPILRFIRDYKGKDINADLYKISAKLISDYHRDDEQVMILRYPRYPEPFVHQDLMALMGFLRTGVSLKQCAIALKWYTIMDSPFEFTHTVEQQDIKEIIKYNINDCLITNALYKDHYVTESRELRENLAEQYGDAMLSAADSKIANLMLESLYEKSTGIPRKEFKEGRTHRESVKFSDVILNKVKFETEELISLLSELKNVTVYDTNKFKFEKNIVYKGNQYNLGVGGLHTEESPHVYRATENKKIITMDVASYYPSMMLVYNIKPEHIKEDLLKIFSRVKKERIEAKRAGDKTKADSFKILLNSTFGKLGFNNYFLYDPLAMLQVTVNGQLFLLRLVEMMEKNGIHCISSNTDGCEFEIKKEQESLALSLAKEWQEETGFELEFDYYDLYCKKDVNNYIARNTHGKIKTKGAFLDTIDLKKQNRHLIIPKAVNNYFLYGTAVEDTIMSCKDIFDFCLSQKIGKQFDMEQVILSKASSDIPPYTSFMKKGFLQDNQWYEVSDGQWSYNNNFGFKSCSLDEAFKKLWIEKELGQRKLEKTELQKTNRFFISTKGAVLQKRNKKTQGTIGLMVGQPVTILNDYDPTVPFEGYDINFKWYIKQAKDMIEEIEPTTVQLDMFGNTTLSATTTSLSEETSNKLANTKVPSKPKDILEAPKTKKKFPVSRSFMLVTNISTTEAGVKNITVYNLASGREAKLKMNKVLYGVKAIEVGNLLEITRFSKKQKSYKDGKNYVDVAGEFFYYIESFEIVRDIEKFIKQNRL